MDRLIFSLYPFELTLDTPLLLIAWRRPHTIRQVINAIRPVAPSRLFVACDGARYDRPEEIHRVEATRSTIKNDIDWSCEIQYLYSTTNQGCRLGVSRAITWFFDHVEEGIILEDDCVPHIDFFEYCTSLLERYRDDSRVWCISGSNFQSGIWRGDGSYYFSRYTHCWGWATWRRCWQHYDPDLTQLPQLLNSGLAKNLLYKPLEFRYWSRIWGNIFTSGQPDTWDYQWFFTCFINNGLTALPNRNLVLNIGCDLDSTHRHKKLDNPADGIGPIIHPSFILRDVEADFFTFRSHHGQVAWKIVLKYLHKKIASRMQKNRFLVFQ